MRKKNLLFRLWDFYFSGFRNMSHWSKQAWLVILIKLFIMFAILKIFFFPDFLKKNFDNDQQRGSYVMEIITETK